MYFWPGVFLVLTISTGIFAFGGTLEGPWIGVHRTMFFIFLLAFIVSFSKSFAGHKDEKEEF